MKLALGTVQFGLNYGVSNQLGKVSDQEIQTILTYAKQNSITTLDTANAYGDSECLLGEYAEHAFEIITKINPTAASDVATLVEQSLKRLKKTSVYAVMLHDADILASTQGSAIAEQLKLLKQHGQVTKIGMSLYHPEQLALFNVLTPDIIQIPVNVLDQRFLQSDVLASLAKHKIEIHCRSVFLQGLLLMDPCERNSFFNQFPVLTKFDSFIKTHNASRLETCLGFMKSLEQLDALVVGCCTAHQLAEIVHAWQAAEPLHLEEFSSNETNLIVPSNWQLN